eukprot:703868-Rhodomonas_salina.1
MRSRQLIRLDGTRCLSTSFGTLPIHYLPAGAQHSEPPIEGNTTARLALHHFCINSEQRQTPDCIGRQ